MKVAFVSIIQETLEMGTREIFTKMHPSHGSYYTSPHGMSCNPFPSIK